ncbi:hypothetical protein ACFRQM_28685 [Streptomyces sp. NPDC056831]|uniref:hypothetical protein n=1 Tax=Streptomyces sp. NPDC056831 TaxID=3345954 RepID=UPI0036BCCA05
MPGVPHPVIRAVGGYLRDARKRRFIFPQQPADLLHVSEETVFAMEAGHTPIMFRHIDLLCRLYNCSDDIPALKNLVSAAVHRSGGVGDEVPGHHRRLAGCARQATKVRWLATDLIPPPVQTDDYARAANSPPSNLPGAPLAFQPRPQLLVDERILHTEEIAADVMVEQLQYLLIQEDYEVRVMPGRIPMLCDPMVLMTMPAGFVLAHPTSRGVLYRATEQPPPQVSEVWDFTTYASSRLLLQYATQQHLARDRVHAGAV